MLESNFRVKVCYGGMDSSQSGMGEADQRSQADSGVILKAVIVTIRRLRGHVQIKNPRIDWPYTVYRIWKCT
jgi:hypothetical protein